MANPAQNQSQQIFSRLMVPPEHAPMQPIVSDLYDKIAALQTALAKVQPQK